MNPKHHKPRCPSDQNPLKTRICNQGFVLETLPNVQRPGPSFPGLNPLSVRISSKNQSLIPIIYQYQPSILHKTSSSFYSKKKPNKTPIEDDKKVSSYKIPFLPPLERLNNSSMSGFFNTKQAEFFDSLKKQGSGFELEARHTRFLVEKLSGKLNLDKRYKPAFSIEKAPLVTKTSVIEKLPLLDPSLKRPFSKVDKYIELIMKNVTNLDEFIYLYQESSVEDPYELEVIDYERVKEQGLKEYFTISRQGLCLYENGKPSDFVPLAIWLKERETYDRIKSLRFFSKFRKWKTLRMWKRNLVNSKRKQNRDALEASLFILIPRFRESLLLHKSCCIEIEKLTFMGLSQPQSYTTEIPNLEEFQSQQARKRGIISQKLKELSSECREQVRNCFQDRLELLRNGEDVTKKDPYEEQLKKTQEKGFKSKDTAYENIGFVEELSYEKRSQLRKECSLFLRFAYLVDFLTLDSLKNVYNNSLVELLSDMGSLLNVKESISFSERVNKPISKLKDPLFHLSINAVFSKQIPEAFIKTQIIPNYLPPPLGSSKLEDFSLLCHICIKEESRIKPKIEEEGPEEEEDSDLYYDDEKTFTREICPNLYKIWLEIQPNQEEFLQGILLAIKEGGDSLQVFERWSRHEEMTPFVNILEEWDDMLGEEWELPESCYLNPSDVLSPLELESYLLQLKEILNKAFQRVETYLAGFNEFLMLYWENSRFDPLVFKNSRIIREAETIKETLLLINYQKEVLEEKVPSQADLGLFRIDSTELRDLLLPSPQVLWKKLQIILPEELRFRARVLKDWMLGSSLTMKAGIGSLEDFVKQRNSVQEIENEYTGVKRKLEELNQMAIILKDAGFELKKEEEGLLIDTNQLSVRLSIGLASVLEALAKGMESNALKISRQLIPELIKFVNELDYKVKNINYIIYT